MSNYTYQHDPRISGADFEDDDDYEEVEPTPEEEAISSLRDDLRTQAALWGDAKKRVLPILEAWRSGNQHKTLMLVDEHCEHLMALFDPENSYLVREAERGLEGR